MKAVPPLRECGRGTDAGTEVGVPARGSWDHRNLNAVINPSDFVIPSGRPRIGKARMRLSHRGLRLHARVIPAAFPSGKTGHFWKGVNAEFGSAPAVEAGIISPRAERGDQPGKPGHSLSSLRPNAGWV